MPVATSDDDHSLRRATVLVLTSLAGPFATARVGELGGAAFLPGNTQLLVVDVMYARIHVVDIAARTVSYFAGAPSLRSKQACCGGSG